MTFTEAGHAQNSAENPIFPHPLTPVIQGFLWNPIYVPFLRSSLCAIFFNLLTKNCRSFSATFLQNPSFLSAYTQFFWGRYVFFWDGEKNVKRVSSQLQIKIFHNPTNLFHFKRLNSVHGVFFVTK